MAEGDYFLLRAIATLRSELPPDRQEAFDEWAQNVTPQEQLDELTADGMKRWKEPDVLKPHGEVKDILGLLNGTSERGKK
jgi:hypothetical protein